METIRALPEVVDTRSHEGNGCLESRTAALQYFTGLGPVDMCRLSKVVTSKGDGGEEMNFYHFIHGLDVSDASRISTYITSVMGAQENAPWLSSIFESQKWTIRGGVFCCYNAFERLDVRVEVRIPGIPGVVEYAVDADGNEVCADTDIWEGARLSAMLRALEPVPSSLPALLALPLFGQQDVVGKFVELAVKHFQVGDRLGLTTYQGMGTHMLCELLSQFMIGSRRLAWAVEILWSLQEHYPAVILHVARAYAKYQQIDTALEVISQALRSHPEDSLLLHAEAKLLLKQGAHPELAVEAAELAVQMTPSIWPFWVTLARAYCRAGRYEEALSALNAPVLSANRGEMERELGLPDLKDAQQTTPKSGPVNLGLMSLYPDDYEIWPSQVAAFPGFGRGFGFTHDLDDTVQTIAKDEGAKDVLSALSGCRGASLRPAERRGYAILVGIYNELGWDGLLAKRSNVFLLLDEAEDSTGAWKRTRRRLSTKFVDTLFESLDTDLALMDEWHDIRRNGLSVGTCEHWMHWGSLAERLQKEHDMELAFRICQTRGICLRASLRLLKLYLKHERPLESVAQLSVLCGITAATISSEPHPLLPNQCVPDWLFQAAAQVVCSLGLAYARHAMDFIPAACSPYRSAVLELLRVVEEAGVDGIER